MLPVVLRALLEYSDGVAVLLTTGSAEAHALLKGALPRRVALRRAPFDNPASAAAFVARWRPQAAVFVEAPAARPALVEAAAARGVRLALLNARVPARAFARHYYSPPGRALLRRLVRRFDLIVPQSDVDVGRFRILGADLKQMPGWCSDLKYAAALGTGVWHARRPPPARVAELRRALGGRPVWAAAATHAGEELAAARAAAALKREWPRLLTVIAPRDASRAGAVAAELRAAGLGLAVAVWHGPDSSCGSGSGDGGAAAAAGGDAAAAAGAVGGQQDGSGGLAGPPPQQQPQPPRSRALRGLPPLDAVDLLVVAAPAELPLVYCACEIAFVGNSLLPGAPPPGGHNLAEAAVAGCAVLVGEHAGAFAQMADELNQVRQ